MTARLLLPIAVAISLVVNLGCEEPRAKTTEELYREERALPAVFLTAKTNKRITAPGNQGVFIDRGTGELAWPALACENPNCPGKSQGGEPFLFIAPDPAIVITADGKVGYDRSLVKNDTMLLLGFCPKCLEIRNREAETAEDRSKYSAYIKPYVLPETQKRRQELEQARAKRKAELEERMKRPLEK